MNRNKERLLREYVRHLLLTENDGSFGLDTGGQAPWGGGSVMKAFVGPFTDVLKTAGAELQKVLTRSKTFVKVVLEATTSLLLPFFEAEYGKIFAKEKSELTAIKNKYKDVYDRTNKAIGSGDLATAMFLMAPGNVILKKIVSVGVDKGSDLLSALRGSSSQNSSYLRRGYVLREDNRNDFDKLVKNPETAKQIDKFLEPIRKELKETIAASVEAAKKSVQEVFAAKSIDNLPQSDALKQEILKNIKSQQNVISKEIGSEQQGSERAPDPQAATNQLMDNLEKDPTIILETAKKTLKELTLKSFQERLELFKQGGIEDMAKGYEKAINDIKNIK